MPVTQGRRGSAGWRALSIALCYALALQAVLAAFGTALAAGQAGSAEQGFAICHGGDGGVPTGGDGGNSDKLPCALCAVAVAGGGLLPTESLAPTAPRILASRIAVADCAEVLRAAPARAGLARAPPTTL
jgi:hypothetical protein